MVFALLHPDAFSLLQNILALMAVFIPVLMNISGVRQSMAISYRCVAKVIVSKIKTGAPFDAPEIFSSTCVLFRSARI